VYEVLKLDGADGHSLTPHALLYSFVFFSGRRNWSATILPKRQHSGRASWWSQVAVGYDVLLTEVDRIVGQLRLEMIWRLPKTRQYATYQTPCPSARKYYG
jgi:hypothetical protein